MALTKEAIDNRPKRPANTYMLFSTRRYKTLGDADNKKETVKK